LGIIEENFDIKSISYFFQIKIKKTKNKSKKGSGPSSQNSNIKTRSTYGGQVNDPKINYQDFYFNNTEIDKI